MTCAVVPNAASAGAAIHLLGAHWKPATTVSFSITRGEGIVLGSATVRRHGRFASRVRVPSAATPGRVRIRVTGIDTAGVPRTCDTRFRILSSMTLTAAELPDATVGLTAGGLISLLGVAAALLVVRRRRGASLWSASRGWAHE